VVDPYFLPALLAKGNWTERHDTAAGAATIFTHAMKVAPPKAHWPESLRAQLAHASSVVERHTEVTAAVSSGWRHKETLSGAVTERWHFAIMAEGTDLSTRLRTSSTCKASGDPVDRMTPWSLRWKPNRCHPWRTRGHAAIAATGSPIHRA
jgi:hypothetical protein